MPHIALTPPKLADPQPADLSAEQAFFLIFWPAYPRKIARFAALKAWNALKMGDDDQALLDAIMFGLAQYKLKEWRLHEPQYIPHASSWLNQRRWEDFAL